MRELSSVTDYFVLVSGTSEPHLRAIVDEISEKLREAHGLRPKAIDGTFQTAWVVLDFFDVIVHVMRKDVRDRYDLETLWGDARDSGTDAERPPARLNQSPVKTPEAGQPPHGSMPAAKPPD